MFRRTFTGKSGLSWCESWGAPKECPLCVEVELAIHKEFFGWHFGRHWHLSCGVLTNVFSDHFQFRLGMVWERLLLQLLSMILCNPARFDEAFELPLGDQCPLAERVLVRVPACVVKRLPRHVTRVLLLAPHGWGRGLPFARVPNEYPLVDKYYLVVLSHGRFLLYRLLILLICDVSRLL